MSESTAKRAERSHKLYQELVGALRSGTVAWLAVGEYLAKLRKDNTYKDVMGEAPAGHEWAWEEFLSQPEVGLPYSTAAKFIQLYEVFKERLGLPDGAIGKIRFYRLKAIAPHITEKNKKSLLEAAEHLSRNDFERELVKASKDIDQDQCEHDYEKFVLEQCQKCGHRRKLKEKKSG